MAFISKVTFLNKIKIENKFEPLFSEEYTK